MHMHDPLCVAVAMDQSALKIIPDSHKKLAYVVVETQGKYTNGT